MTSIVGLLLLGGGFFAGMKYQQTKRPEGLRQFAGGPGGGQGGNGTRAGFRPISGEVIKADDTSITVKMQDGSSKIVLLTGTTTINKAETGKKEDLAVGTQVAAFGSDNADGSVTAQNIQINPNRMGMGTPEPTPNKSAKSKDAKEIVVEGINYAFKPSSITVKKGEKTRILFKNTGGTHDFVVDELNIRTAMIQGNTEDFVEFTPDKIGSFKFYCSFGNHRAMGMEGTIIVQ